MGIFISGSYCTLNVSRHGGDFGFEHGFNDELRIFDKLSELSTNPCGSVQHLRGPNDSGTTFRFKILG